MPIAKKARLSVTKPDVRIVPLEDVHLWKQNPRKNDQAVDPLAKILAAHGQRSPVVVWRKNMVIYKGNTTKKALKKLGSKFIKVQFEDFPSEAAATAYGIADNKSNEFSEWDDDILVDLLSIDEIKVLKKAIGFSEEELRGLSMEADIGEIGKLKKTDTGIKATIKITCRPEDRDEMRVLLTGWAMDSGFQDVVVK